MNKTIKVFQREFLIFIFLVIANSCVEPPEYDDGLLQNIPAIINENDYFSFTINAKNYIINDSWNLLFDADSTDTLIISLVVKNLSSLITDSTLIRLYNENNNIISNIPILGNMTEVSSTPLEMIENPKKFEFLSNKLSGFVDFQLIKQ